MNLFASISDGCSNLNNKFARTGLGSKWYRVRKRNRYQIGLSLFVIIFVVILAAITQFKFFRVSNLLSLSRTLIFLIVGGFGMMFIFGSGIIDLSVGANILLSGCLGAYVGQKIGGAGGLVVFLLITVVSGIIFGQLSVLCTLYLHIPAWVAGLGAGLILEAVLNIWGEAVTSLPNISTDLTLRWFGRNPGMYILIAIAIVAAFIIYNKTTLGVNLQAVGRNPAVSSNSGIKVRKTIIISTLIGGLFIGLAAFFNMSDKGFVSSQLNLGSLNTIFRLLAVIMLADALTNVFSQPIAIIFSSVLVASCLNVFTLLTGKTSTELNLFLGILVVIAGIISHIGKKEVVK